MSTLDDKLRAIAHDIQKIPAYAENQLEATDSGIDKVKLEAVKKEMVDACIQQIRQVFDEDEQNQMRNWTMRHKGLMTGQEWYNRFRKELSADDINLDHEDDVLETPQVLLAARRAAGLTGEEQ